MSKKKCLKELYNELEVRKGRLSSAMQDIGILSADIIIWTYFMRGQ